MVFRSRGARISDSSVASINDILKYRDTYTEPLENFNFNKIIFAERKSPERVGSWEPTESGYNVKKKKSNNDIEIYQRKINSAMNKLTEENYDVVSKSLLVPDTFDDKKLPAAVSIIFEKALDEELFLRMYTKLLKDMFTFEDVERLGTAGLRKQLVNKSQNVFETLRQKTEELAETHAKLKAELKEAEEKNDEIALKRVQDELFDYSQEEAKKRKRQISNIHFVASLLNGGLMSYKVCTNILEVTLQQPFKDSEVHVAIELLKRCGKNITGESIKSRWDIVYSIADAETPPEGLSKRVWMNAKDAKDLRENGFVEKKPLLPEAPPPPPPQQQQQQQVFVSNGRGLGTANINQTTSMPTATVAPPDYPGPKQPSREDMIRKEYLPPLSDEQERKVISVFNDAIEDELTTVWKTVISSFSSLNPNEELKLNRAAAAYVAIKQICNTPKGALGKNKEFCEKMRKVLTDDWDREEILQACAWTLLRSITLRFGDDAPFFNDSFVHFLRSLQIKCTDIATEVFLKAADYLHVSDEIKEETEEWQSQFLVVWEKFVIGAVQISGKNSLSVKIILDKLAPLCECSDHFICDVVEDFVFTMHGVKTYREQLDGWKKEQDETSPLYCMLQDT